MTTHYFVKCPHMRCRWFGSLPAHPDLDYRRAASSNVSLVTFQCPHCHREWRARMIGDDIETLPLEAEEDLALTVPEFDVGGSD